MTPSTPPLSPPLSTEDRLQAISDQVAAATTPKRSLPLSRKLGYGAGIGAPVTLLLFEALRLWLGYSPSPEILAATQSVVSFGIGWLVREQD